jgi:hypothetical protein
MKPITATTMNKTLNGKWSYRSFRHDPIVVKDGQVEGNPELASPWSPPGELHVETGDNGEVSGILIFVPGRVELKVVGSITPATEKLPASVELTATFQSNINKIKGIFLEGTDNVVGTVIVLAGDLAGAPNGTAGPFILFPIRAKS